MIIFKEGEAIDLIHQGEQEFKYRIEPNITTKLQLFLTGKITKGVELFGIGGNELRAFGFLVEYHKVINNAVNNHYRIFVIKEGIYFGKGNWILKFIKKSGS